MNIARKAADILRYGFPHRRPAVPTLVIFHITTRCNMACRHCGDDVWGDPGNDLSLEDIEQFSASLGPIENLALGGGEPFLRDDLAEMCRLFHLNNKVERISIPSNGFAPERICSTVQTLLTACPGLHLNVMLSLDGFEQTHDTIRRDGAYARVMETARRLTALRADIPRLSLSFNATIAEINHREIPELARFVAREFQARLEFNIISGTPRDPAMKRPRREELKAVLATLLDSSGRSFLRRLYDRVYQDVLLAADDETSQIVPCRAGSLVCVIDANGDVRACPLLPPLGNLREQSFHNIWRSPRAMETFGSIINGTCACNNDCFIRLSLMNYWKLPFMMVRKLLQR